jgi:hypothetical protein
MEFEYEGKKYKDGDKIVFEYRDIDDFDIWRCAEGIINFEAYDDNEQYKNNTHLGFIVNYKMYRESIGYFDAWETFPDVVMMIKARNIAKAKKDKK